MKFKFLAAAAIAAFSIQAQAGIVSDYDKSVAAADGWSILYQGDYTDSFDLAAILGGISAGTTYALATSSSDGAATFDLFGSTSLNLLDIRGTTRNQTTFADGAYWYWNNYETNGFVEGSVGFADTATISQNQADTTSGDLRLSWHTGDGGADMVNFGWRSGVNTSLNGNSTWQRYILTLDAQPVSEPSVLLLLATGFAGLGFLRARGRRRT